MKPEAVDFYVNAIRSNATPNVPANLLDAVTGELSPDELESYRTRRGWPAEA